MGLPHLQHQNLDEALLETEVYSVNGEGEEGISQSEPIRNPTGTPERERHVPIGMKRLS